MTLNNAVLSLFEMVLFLIPTYRYFEFTNTYEAMVFASYAYYPMLIIFFVFGSFLDILVCIERCSFFIKKLKSAMSITPKNICSVLFLTSIIIGLPYFFLLSPHYFDAPLDENQIYKIWFMDYSQFGRSTAGKIVAHLLRFTKDVLLLIIEILVNITSVYILKKHFNIKKNILLNKNRLSRESMDKLEIKLNSSEPKRTQSIYDSSQVLAFVNVDPLSIFKLNKIERANTILAIFMCSFSIIIHILNLFYEIYFYVSYDMLGLILFAISNFFIVFKCFSCFFFFYLFNSRFKKIFKSIFFRF